MNCLRLIKRFVMNFRVRTVAAAADILGEQKKKTKSDVAA